MLFIKYITDNKLDTLYTEAFEVLDVKGIIVYFKLLDTRIFPKFYISLVKKVPRNIPLADR